MSKKLTFENLPSYNVKDFQDYVKKNLFYKESLF